MKVLMINSVCGIRSTGRICTDLADILKKQGHECLIAYGREYVPEKYENISYRIGADIDIKLHVLKSRFFDAAGFGSKKATQRLVEKMIEYDPDIIHLHNIHGYYVNVEILFNYLKTCGKKIVWTLHDCWAFTGHCAHFDYANCNKWQSGCFMCPETSNYPKSLCDHSTVNYERKKESFTDVKDMIIVTPSKWLADLVQKSFLKEYPVNVISNGIDLDKFRPTKGTFRQNYRLENKKIVLGVASAWTEKKGLNDFEKLSEMLDRSYQIVLVGLTEKQKEKLPVSILGITQTNDVTELAELYSAADVFVNLTYEDTYPTVNLEALSCGTAVITYQTGGSPETLPSCCGRVVSKGNLIEVKKAVEELCSGKIILDCDRAALGKEACYQKYLDLFNCLMKGDADSDENFGK